MLKPLSLYIGLRYTRSKRRNHFISFISLSSMLGIALGVAVLITVLSVMNGFDNAISHQVFSLAREVTLSHYSGRIGQWRALENKIQQAEGVVTTEPFVSGQGMLTHAGIVRPVLAMGILPEAESKLSELENKMITGRLNNLQAGRYGIVLGQALAQRLNVYLGDKVTLVTADANLTPAGVILRSKRFTVVGLFEAGSGFGFDDLWAFIHLKDAQTLFKTGDAVNGFWIKTQSIYKAPLIAHQLIRFLPQNFAVSDWTEDYGAFFQAIHLEKNMMALILLLLVAIAAFNLVAGLVMVVTDKRADIAILRTLGARSRTIMGIFIVQGTVIGLFGTILGVIGGLLLSSHVTEIVNLLEHLLHVQLISSSVYYIDYLPSDIQLTDVSRITLIAFLMSVLATLYPAYRAAHIQPAEALRYE
ncbi:MAG: lolE 2 [Gammaproteobacteria bacterium]|jgi:lipoprotein-releasing system permease protein|nr:lolE 2 [Gammaproteobacteria bacterium]